MTSTKYHNIAVSQDSIAGAVIGPAIDDRRWRSLLTGPRGAGVKPSAVPTAILSADCIHHVRGGTGATAAAFDSSLKWNTLKWNALKWNALKWYGIKWYRPSSIRDTAYLKFNTAYLKF